jgi:hypothetical protein
MQRVIHIGVCAIAKNKPILMPRCGAVKNDRILDQAIGATGVVIGLLQSTILHVLTGQPS